MPTPPAPPLFAMARGEPAFDLGRAASVGAAQRDSLGRGLAFVLLLTAALLTSVYVPTLLHGPDWVEGTAPEPHGAASLRAPAGAWAENTAAFKPSRRTGVDPAPGTGLTRGRCAPRAEPVACRSSTTSSSDFSPA